MVGESVLRDVELRLEVVDCAVSRLVEHLVNFLLDYLFQAVDLRLLHGRGLVLLVCQGHLASLECRFDGGADLVVEIGLWRTVEGIRT